MTVYTLHHKANDSDWYHIFKNKGDALRSLKKLLKEYRDDNIILQLNDFYNDYYFNELHEVYIYIIDDKVY